MFAFDSCCSVDAKVLWYHIVVDSDHIIFISQSFSIKLDSTVCFKFVKTLKFHCIEDCSQLLLAISQSICVCGKDVELTEFVKMFCIVSKWFFISLYIVSIFSIFSFICLFVMFCDISIQSNTSFCLYRFDNSFCHFNLKDVFFAERYIS